VVQFEGAGIKGPPAQGGELRMAIFESPNVRCIGCRARLRFQITVAFGAGPIARGHDVYAAVMFAVA
jgi:hypothetical protein